MTNHSYSVIPKLNYLTVLDVIVDLFPDFLNLTHTHLGNLSESGSRAG